MSKKGKPMKVLITGGAGFVGSHLAEALLARGDDVSIIDDLSTGSMQNIEHLKLRYGASNGSATPLPRFRFFSDTLSNIPLLADLIGHCDMVFHLAAAVGVKLIVESAVRTIETNVRGTEIVLELANNARKKVLLTSTSEVYGKASKVPFMEDDDLVLGPTVKSRWAYACSKALDEFLAYAYWQERKLPVVIVRLFNTVGPRQTGRYGMVLPTFVRQACQNEPITIFGDGKQSRCFGYIADVVEALIGLADCESAVGNVFNIGNPTEISIEALAHLVKELSRSSSPITYVPYSEAYSPGFEDMPRRLPDISKIRRFIQWEPKVQLREIIESVIAFERGKETVEELSRSVQAGDRI
jgi:UDP-glucose 4-epimerase